MMASVEMLAYGCPADSVDEYIQIGENRSHLFDDIVNGVAPPCNFVVQGHQYDMGYYLSDGIYPQYAALIQTISSRNTTKEKFFAKRQEAVRKDVEREFGVLQARWHIVKGTTRMWNVKDIGKIMKICIILHNMIIEHERQQGVDPESWRPLPDETLNLWFHNMIVHF
ncbi:uncharacterized protein LOC113341372 [Papaver somniferum]|uniref:uncharacterized protein LOC113341372 n=1 Tax=Papaver somniferum TaxID=3469 RepID=UPI000E6F8AF4|nr:uncharacterized protein LOC113341372 [Papaver somniferum]